MVPWPWNLASNSSPTYLSPFAQVKVPTSNQAAKFGADDRELRREEWQPAVEEALRVLEGRVEAQTAGAHPHASHDDDAGGAA